jgi:hypothetical protein
MMRRNVMVVVVVVVVGVEVQAVGAVAVVIAAPRGVLAIRLSAAGGPAELLAHRLHLPKIADLP